MGINLSRCRVTFRLLLVFASWAGKLICSSGPFGCIHTVHTRDWLNLLFLIHISYFHSSPSFRKFSTLCQIRSSHVCFHVVTLFYSYQHVVWVAFHRGSFIHIKKIERLHYALLLFICQILRVVKAYLSTRYSLSSPFSIRIPRYCRIFLSFLIRNDCTIIDYLLVSSCTILSTSICVFEWFHEESIIFAEINCFWFQWNFIFFLNQYFTADLVDCIKIILAIECLVSKCWMNDGFSVMTHRATGTCLEVVQLIFHNAVKKLEARRKTLQSTKAFLPSHTKSFLWTNRMSQRRFTKFRW